MQLPTNGFSHKINICVLWISNLKFIQKINFIMIYLNCKYLVLKCIVSKDKNSKELFGNK